MLVSDIDNTVIQGATISITGNFASGEDQLQFIDQAGITGIFDSSTGILILSGTSDVANYQAALQSVTYSNTSDDPSPLTRTLEFSVNDGLADSNLLQRNIEFTLSLIHI